MGDTQKADFGLQRSPDGSFVQFGVVFANGGFFPFAATKAGDYDEALAADAQPQPPAQPVEPVPEPQPEPTAVPEGEGQ